MSRARIPFLAAVLCGAWLGAGRLAQVEDAAGLRARAAAALAQAEGTVSLAGLHDRVEVIRDRWGIPHIYARDVDDLFFAQGFVAAQDRLWQLDLWRRTADGTLAEVVGPSAVDRDTFARLLRYRGDMEQEWRSYSPDAKRIVEAFVRGINAHIAAVALRPETLPIEFQLTGVKPKPWTPDVVLGRMAGYVMTRNARTEVQRARLAQAIGLSRVNDFLPPDPPVSLQVPDGLDLADITGDILRLAETAGDPVSFEERRPAAAALEVAAPDRSTGGFASRHAWAFRAPAAARVVSVSRAAADALLDLGEQYSTIGSNNWVVAGALTASGRPVLANDPHRALQLPSLRYTVHLNAPGWNVIGAGEPALPGVAAGHNDRIAFGFTIVGTDQQDLYVERLNPEKPDEYLDRGRWAPMRIEREELPVKGEPPRVVELRFTRHGPVVHVDRARHRAYALRWVGMEPGTAGYLASLSLDVARDWPTFLAALEGWKVPSENLVYADVDGNVGWVAAGMTPVRANWNGLLPVPGQDGRYEWSGFLPVKDMPQSFNPASGIIATANHNILPPGYRHAIGYEWSASHRYQRIMEVLPSRRGFSVADFEGLQHDVVSVPARTIVEALRVAVAAAPPVGRERAFAAKLMTSWDARLSLESGPAALYELWLPHLEKAMAGTVTRPQERAFVPERVSLERLLAIVRAPTPEQLAVLTGSSLEDAWRDAVARMGEDPSSWAWGRLHFARFDHPLATTKARQDLMNLPASPRGGDGTTVNATGMGLRQVSGASYRQVLDVGSWDDSRTINVPGQSGQPGSPHYGDLLPIWASGGYHPLAFSRDAVDRVAAARLILVPAGTAPPTGLAQPPSADGGTTTRADPVDPGAPVLPPFAGSVVNFDRRAGRVAACALDPGGGEYRSGARNIPNTRVWVVEEEVVRRLGSSTGACDPSWSPDGSRLAVVQPNGLWTYSPTLEDPQQLADTHLPADPRNEFDYTAFARPRWSPDGRHLAFLVTNGATTWVEAVETKVGRRVFKSEPGVSGFAWDPQAGTLLVDGRPVRLQ